MQIFFSIFLILSGLYMIGCHHAPCPRIESTNIYHDELHSPPIIVNKKNEANVRLPERVKAYAVNRYIDPANPRIMHERHVMYRIEEDPSWRLFANEEQQILIGNTLTNGKLNYNPALMEKELALELERQRFNNEMLQNQSEMLIDAGINLNKDQLILLERIEQFKQIVEEQRETIDTQSNKIEKQALGK